MLTIEKLKPHHDVSDFKSTEKDLEDFLKNDALINQYHNISVTNLLFIETELIGYVSLLNDRLDLDKPLKALFSKKTIRYRCLPSIKIGRLCIAKKHQKKGYGKKLIMFTIKLVTKQINNYSGCRYITLDSKENALGFYLKNKFQILSTKKRQKTMYLDINKSYLKNNLNIS